MIGPIQRAIVDSVAAIRACPAECAYTFRLSHDALLSSALWSRRARVFEPLALPAPLDAVGAPASS